MNVRAGQHFGKIAHRFLSAAKDTRVVLRHGLRHGLRPGMPLQLSLRSAIIPVARPAWLGGNFSQAARTSSKTKDTERWKTTLKSKVLSGPANAGEAA